MAKPSIDSYYRELHIDLTDYFGKTIKSFVLDISDIDELNWRDTNEPNQLRVTMVMRDSQTQMYALPSTAFWNQAVE